MYTVFSNKRLVDIYYSFRDYEPASVSNFVLWGHIMQLIRLDG